MSRLWTILRHEWRLMYRDGHIVLPLVIVAITSFTAAHWGRISVERQRESAQRLAAAERNRMLREQSVAFRLWKTNGPFAKAPAYGPLDPQYVRNFAGFSVIGSPTPLGALAEASDELDVAAYKVVPSGSIHTSGAAHTTVNPLQLLIGSFDLELVVIVILSLSVLGISYSIVSAERESGVASLLLSTSTHPQVLVFAKVLSRGAVVVLFCASVAAAGLWASGDNLFGVDGVERLVVWTATVLLYGFFWLMAAWFFGSIAGSSSRIALLLGGLWLASVVVIPSVLRFAAARLYPVAPRTAFLDAIRRGPDKVPANDSAKQEAFLQRHPEFAGLSLGPSGTAQLTGAARSEEWAGVLDQIVDKYEGQQQRQRKFVARWSWLSPSLLAQRTLRDAAGITGREERFRNQARTYQQALEAFYWPLLFGERVFTPDLYGLIPRFQYREEPLREVMPRTLLLVLAIAAWVGGFGFAAFLVGLRNRVFV